MALPSNGFRQLMVLTDEDGNEVSTVLDGSTRRLAVDASIAGPIVIGGVELDDGGGGTTRAQIKATGAAFNAAPNDGALLVAGRDPTGPTHRALRMTANTELVTVTPNLASFATNQKNVAVAGTAETLQAQPIPDGFSILVKAKQLNVGTIRIGNSAANAQSATVAFTLTANQSVRLFVTNANLIFIDATVSGEGVEWIVEQS